MSEEWSQERERELKQEFVDLCNRGEYEDGFEVFCEMVNACSDKIDDGLEQLSAGERKKTEEELMQFCDSEMNRLMSVNPHLV